MKVPTAAWTIAASLASGSVSAQPGTPKSNRPASAFDTWIAAQSEHLRRQRPGDIQFDQAVTEIVRDLRAGEGVPRPCPPPPSGPPRPLDVTQDWQRQVDSARASAGLRAGVSLDSAKFDEAALSIKSLKPSPDVLESVPGRPPCPAPAPPPAPLDVRPGMEKKK